MEKPFLKYLEYELRTSDEVSFNDPEPLEYENDEFKLTLKDNVLRLIPKIHFNDIEKAKSYIHEFIRSWEIDFALERGNEIEFIFTNAEFIKKENTLSAVTGNYILIGEEFSSNLTLNRYPRPNPDFKASDTVANMFFRYRGHLRGKEPLLAMAYYCLTELQDYHGSTGRTKKKRNKASKVFKIELDVLNMLGTISSTKGGKTSRRKAGNKNISDTEILWVQRLIPKLIKQIGKHEAGKLEDDDTLTMNDLPNI